MNINDIIDKYISKLFINYYNEIDITEEIKNEYSWNNMSKNFNFLYEQILKFSNKTEFIKYYYLITLFYINYTNFLKYINHEDCDLEEIYEFMNKKKYNVDIIKYIFDNKNDLESIISTLNPFIKKKFLNNKNTTLIQINDFLTNVKQLDNIYTETTTNQKKILNIVLYRYILSNSSNNNSFHDFFIKNIIEDTLNYEINFNAFMESIPNYKNIVDLNVSQDIKNNLKIQLSQLVNFLIKDYPTVKMNIVTKIDKTKYIELINSKFGGKIIIKKSLNKLNEINIYQQNINLIGFNIKELKNYSFIKKTNNFIEIEYSSSIINNLSNLLHLTHLITCGLKLLETYPSSINECIYPIDYNKYYYKSFYNFLNFIKSNINQDMSYNRFLIDLIKYYYIYSYYDYYFYYNSNLIKTIIDRIKYKNNIFNEFCASLKHIFKLPNEMTNYPPFFNINDDIDNLIYYNLEIPNYFKFCDLISAIINVFNINISNPSKIDLLKIIQSIKCNNIIPLNNDVNTKDYKNNSISKSLSSDSTKDENNLKVKEKEVNNNAFIELNIENSDNYALNTDLHF